MGIFIQMYLIINISKKTKKRQPSVKDKIMEEVYTNPIITISCEKLSCVERSSKIVFSFINGTEDLEYKM